MIGFAVTKIPDPTWGEPRIARAIAQRGDPWGVLALLRGTPWEDLFPEIPAGIFDQALRGFSTPMMRVIGLPPEALLKRVPPAHRPCRLRGGCINSSPTCIPGPSMPDCWESEILSPEAGEVATKVALLWREGTHIIVVRPEGR